MQLRFEGDCIMDILISLGFLLVSIGSSAIANAEPVQFKLTSRDQVEVVIEGPLTQKENLFRISEPFYSLFYLPGMKENLRKTAVFPEASGTTLNQIVHLLRSLDQFITDHPQGNQNQQVHFLLEDIILREGAVLENLEELLAFSHPWQMTVLTKALIQVLNKGLIENHSDDVLLPIFSLALELKIQILRELVSENQNLTPENAIGVLELFSLLHNDLGNQSPHPVSTQEFQLFVHGIKKKRPVVFPDKEVMAFHNDPRSFMTDLSRIHRNQGFTLYQRNGQKLFHYDSKTPRRSLFTPEQILDQSFVDQKIEVQNHLIDIDTTFLQSTDPYRFIELPLHVRDLKEMPRSASNRGGDRMERSTGWSGLDWNRALPLNPQKIREVVQKYEKLIGVPSRIGETTNEIFHPLGGLPYLEKKLNWVSASLILNTPEKTVQALSYDRQQTLEFSPLDLQILQSLYANHSEAKKMILGVPGVPRPRTEPMGRIFDLSYYGLESSHFHIALVNRFLQNRSSFVLESTYDPYLFHEIVKGYQYEFFNPATGQVTSSMQEAQIPRAAYFQDPFHSFRRNRTHSVVGVFLRLQIVEPLSDTDGDSGINSTREITLFYDLELDDHNKIVGGEWYHQAHPDFLWAIPHLQRYYQRLSLPPYLKSTDWNNPRTNPIPETWQKLAHHTYSRRGKLLPEVIEQLNSWSH
jgi:hypothetical protein